jgi:hypothetical protein
MVPIVGAMRKFRVGWRPNVLNPIAERHFGAERVEFSRHLGAIASVIPIGIQPQGDFAARPASSAKRLDVCRTRHYSRSRA